LLRPVVALVPRRAVEGKTATLRALSTVSPGGARSVVVEARKYFQTFLANFTGRLRFEKCENDLPKKFKHRKRTKVQGLSGVSYVFRFISRNKVIHQWFLASPVRATGGHQRHCGCRLVAVRDARPSGQRRSLKFQPSQHRADHHGSGTLA